MLQRKIALLTALLLCIGSSLAATDDSSIFESFWIENGGLIVRFSLSVLSFMPFIIISRYFAESSKAEFKVVALVFGLAVAVMLGFGLDNATVEMIRVWLNAYSVYILVIIAGLIAATFLLRKNK